MKIAELLQEAPLQSILKGGFKPAGTIADIAGDVVDAVCAALHAKPGDKAMVFKASTPQQEAAAKSVLGSARRVADGFDVATLIGKRKLAVLGGKIYTTAADAASMVA